MLTYALVALGGALGSVLRAALGNAMVALTGPAFPWGTVLINVLGSFVIGFFGALTATDGRFAAPADLRTFVMVGICGGFTTFSSFSLQTFDLLRDDRAGQALGNVLLSVLLCLGSVAAGHAAATWLRLSGPAGLAAAGGGNLAGRSVVALYRPEAIEPMLGMAAGLMARDNDRTTVLAIDGPALAGRLPTEEVMTEQRRDEMAATRRAWVEAMRPALDRWVAAERARGHRARWIAVRGDGLRPILEHGRGSHLLLLEHRPDDPAGSERIHAALEHAGRPVLLVPPGSSGRVGRCIAVAWRDDEQARRAVDVARPILAGAERVVVLQVDGRDPSPLPGEVFHDLAVERRAVPARNGDTGAQLLDMAAEVDADLLVMGGYDRGELRERLFDGVTEQVLREARLPVLLQPRRA